MNNRKKGIEGENIAVEYLKKQKYKILERNYSTKLGEIDIIALDKDMLVFVEVKSRDNLSFGQPIEAITPQKVHKFLRTAQYYLVSKGKQNEVCRFDVIEIINDEVRHTKDAFRA